MTHTLSAFTQRVARRSRIYRRRLRWVIKISAPYGESGDAWGDVAFANDLALALTRRGQKVRVDRQGSPPLRSSDFWDDVNLILRGLEAPVPQANRVNLMWIISHPDLVSADEIRMGWHRVYAASDSWSKKMSVTAGVEVIPLLQAVSRDRFSPDGPKRNHAVLFVGTTRGVKRPVVLDAASVSEDLEVFGHGWEGVLPDGLVRADRLAFDEVPRSYRGAQRVLNDHWEDMKREGFVSNRLFDAVASGALVVSDDVAGTEQLFGNSVRTYRDRDELKTLLSSEAGWPNLMERRERAQKILREQSFDMRAKVLVHDALERITRTR